MIIQVLLGIFVHWIKVKPHKFRTVSDRGPSNFIHMFIGVIIMLIGWATVWEGESEIALWLIIPNDAFSTG